MVASWSHGGGGVTDSCGVRSTKEVAERGESANSGVLSRSTGEDRTAAVSCVAALGAYRVKYFSKSSLPTVSKFTFFFSLWHILWCLALKAKPKYALLAQLFLHLCMPFNGISLNAASSNTRQQYLWPSGSRSPHFLMFCFWLLING